MATTGQLLQTLVMLVTLTVCTLVLTVSTLRAITIRISGYLSVASLSNPPRPPESETETAKS